MKSRFLLFLPLIAIYLAGQSANQYGHRIGVQVTYLVAAPEQPEPPPAISGRFSTQIRQANVGLTSVVPDTNDVIPVPPEARQIPCAEFETWVEHASRDFAESIVAGSTGIERLAGKATIQRFLKDDLRRIYVSYAVTVETLQPAGTYRITFAGPAPGNDPQLRASENWTVLSPSRYPVPQIVKDGEEIALELYVDRRTGQALVDYVRAGHLGQMTLRREAPHDSYTADGEFEVTRPRLTVNGLPQESATLPDAIRGPVLWIYIPGHGRFVLSYAAHSDLGFQRAGEVAGNSLTLTAGGNVFRIECASRIASGSGAYSIHVLADPAWAPADPRERARFTVGSSPGVESAVGR